MKRQGSTRHMARWLLAALLAAALIAGLVLGQAAQLFAYAWPLCLPCIGIQ
jgi:heme A synthase